jgi:hypothetical protein
MKICRVTGNLVEIEQKYGALYMNTKVRFTVAGGTNSTRNHFCTKLTCFILFTMACKPKNTQDCTVKFPLQQWFFERAKGPR